MQVIELNDKPGQKDFAVEVNVSRWNISQGFFIFLWWANLFFFRETETGEMLESGDQKSPRLKKEEKKLYKPKEQKNNYILSIVWKLLCFVILKL